MEKQFRLASLTVVMLMMASMVFFSGCKDDDEPTTTPAPAASFQYEVNVLEVTFTNYSQNATSYVWDFGDNAGTSTEKDPIYTYTDGGTYTVTLTATGAGGSAEYSKDVTVIMPGGTNLIENGTFDDESIWTIIQHNGNNNATITIADGVATYDDIVQGEWGTEGHIGMNQAVTVEAGLYQMNLYIVTNGMSDIYFEVWIGTEEPVAEADYGDGNGATKVLSFNSWACGDANNTYSGPMAAVSCEETDGTVTLEAGTYYVVIRGGGLNWGDDGIVIDDVTMVKI